MNDRPLPSALRETSADQAAKALKLIGAGLPVLGPFLTELVDHLIPNQRQERWASYIADLGRRMKAIEDRAAAADLSPEQIALFEDGAYASVRATSPERISQIAKIVADGLNDQTRDTEHKRYLLRVLSEMSDVELAELIARVDKKPGNNLSSARLGRLEGLGVLYTETLLISEESSDMRNGFGVSDVGREIAEILKMP